jgi:hypothetical protein
MKRKKKEKLGMPYFPLRNPNLFISFRLWIALQFILNDKTSVRQPYQRLILARLLLIGLILRGNRSLRARATRNHRGLPTLLKPFVTPANSFEDAVLLSSVA